MDKPVYLQSFSASDFRGFGNVGLDFAAAPGIVILVGPNGLGKTSWFEAVEVALTGKVARWQDIEKRSKVKPLKVRRGAEVASVQLLFKAHSVEEISWTSTTGCVGEAGPLLCEDPQAWGLTSENLAGFLRATHLFPQSASVRTLHRAPTERWDDILRHVSGFDQLSRLSENLGQGVLKSLTARVNSMREKELERVILMEQWRGRLHKLRLQEKVRVEVGDALSPESALELVRPHLGENVSFGERPVDGALLASVINARCDALRHEEVQLGDLQESLAMLWGDVAEWSATEARLASLDEERLQLTVRATDSERELGIARQNTEQAEASLHQEESRLAVVRKRAVSAQEFVALTRRLDELKATAHEARRDIERVDTEISTRRDIIQEGVESRHAHSAWRTQGARLQEQRAKLESLRAVLARLDVLNREVVEVAEHCTEAERVSLAATSAAEESATEMRLARSALHASKASFHEAREGVGAIQSAVSLILQHLEVEDDECPVCHAVYDEPGSLLGRARSDLVVKNSSLTAAEARLRAEEERYTSVRLRNDAIRHSAIRAEGELVASEQHLRKLKSDIDDLHRREVVLQYMKGGVSVEELEAEQERAETIWRAAERAVPPATHDATVEEYRLEQAVRRRDERLLEMRAAEEQSVVAIVQLERLSSGVMDPSGENYESLLLLVAAGEESVQKATSSVESARRLVARTQEMLQSCVGEMERVSVQEHRLKQAQSLLLERWRKANLSLEPSIDGLIAKEKWCESRRQMLSETQKVLRQAGVRLGAWLQDVEIRNERERLCREAKGQSDKDLDAHVEFLGSAVERATVQWKQAECARKLAGELADSALERKDSLYETLQSNLTVALAQILPRLIKNRMFHSVIPSIEASRRSTSFSPRSQSGEHIEAMASEGQLSGLGFGVQLAMALSFPWSRWRGLLLDDPLQYSDIVHTSNLIEVLRLLSLQHGFQIFLSTHETGLAEYAFRKFRNAGLAAEKVLFRESGGGEGHVPVSIG